MFPKGKVSAVPSDGQAREKLALYVYEYLLHIGAQKSAQTFLSEIRWEKNITLGEPPGFLHSWWCVFWDLYCAAPERRETCDHSSEAKAFHDYSAAAAPSPVMGGMPPGEGMPGGPMPPGFFQIARGTLQHSDNLQSKHLCFSDSAARSEAVRNDQRCHIDKCVQITG
ncbi:unnamed protein product [Oncorhynchus mykiss]|uniref:Uncharacterized protein n=1 Tax=Oncorhynchus mykiss TaxID=8022 RepID=A0A060X569_ONCMY|nr:unnamed protein product [Oncorhynchus mykiss]